MLQATKFLLERPNQRSGSDSEEEGSTALTAAHPWEAIANSGSNGKKTADRATAGSFKQKGFSQQL